jgi:flagellar biosynthetic protein FliR
MTLSVQAQPILATLLVAVRIVAWLVIAPPFAGRSVPAQVKVVLAVGLGLTAVPDVKAEQLPTDTVPLLLEVFTQTFIGAGLGFLTYLIFAAVQAAGDLIDVFGGFSLAASFDPLSQTMNSVFGKLFQLLATLLLFVSGAHLIVIAGVLKTFSFLPIGASPDLSNFSGAMLTGVELFFTCAVQIALPLIGVLFVTDLGLALMTRIAPQLNAIMLSFPAKIGLTLLTVGLSMSMLPEAVSRLTDLIIEAMSNAVGA